MSQSLISTSCNICGSREYSILFPPGSAQVNQIVKCKQCGLMYANPRREADHVHIESWPEDPNWDFEEQNRQRFEKELLQTKDYDSTRALLNEFYPQRGILLEVGSSTGTLLKTFRADGWTVLGVEPDRHAARYSKERLGIETINSTLERAKIGDQSVDVVVLLHVIEHLPDPVGTLREINRVLKPGGHLVLETPKYDTLMFKLLGKRERSLSCDGHIFFFTSNTLQRAYQKASFSLVKFEAVGRSLTLDRLAYNLGVVSKSRTVSRALNAVARPLMFHKIKFSINFRDMQRVCLRKLDTLPSVSG